MTAVLVSAKVSVFLQQDIKTFPKSSQRFYLEKTLIKQKTQPKHRLDKLFITKHDKKLGIKIKLGCLPASANV